MGELSGRIAVVSGASAGIGLAIARELHVRGARLVINARRGDRLESLAESMGGDRVAVVPGDASSQTTVEAMLDAARERFEREADLIIVNAGRGLAGSVTSSDVAHWDEMIRTNLVGAALLMRRAAARMRERGPDPEEGDSWLRSPRDIVVIGSNVGRHISPFSSMYGSTKFAVNSLAEALRRELAPHAIRVTLIAPGVVRSEFQEIAGYDPVGFGGFMERIGPVLDPEDVAGLVAFVVSRPAHVHVNDVVIRPTRQEYP
ncbi:MAG: SDR family oxidoreductase [Phycisphaeraceae bacterium]|nr:SDR family oxidoreductase [Phycisphaeraceae bacterium]